jgi:molybdopterin biosynthesis enzyme MoaB
MCSEIIVSDRSQRKVQQDNSAAGLREYLQQLLLKIRNYKLGEAQPLGTFLKRKGEKDHP